MAQLNILVDIKPDSSSSPLLEKVRQLAERNTLKVLLYVCDYHSSLASSLLLHPDGLDKAIAHFKTHHLNQLQALADASAHDNIEYSLQVDWHKPVYEGILNAAKAFKADLVLKESHPHSKIKQLFFTPNDWQLLKSSEAPLLLSKGKSWQQGACIMAAVDPSHQLSQTSHLDDTVIQQAKEFAQWLNIPLKVCHVFDPTGWEVVMNSAATAGVMGQFIVLDTPDDHRAMLKQIREEHEKQLRKLQERHQLSNDQVQLLEGFPEQALEEASDQQNAAILVVGTTYRSGLMGSTAEKLLEHVSCDIVAVKPGDFSALDTH